MDANARALEQVLHAELNDPGIHTGGCDLAKRRSELNLARGGRSNRIIELSVIEGVKELGAEDERLSLRNLRRLHDRDIPIELTGPENHTNTRITEARSIAEDASGWSGAERRGIEVPRTAAIAAQALRQASTG